MIRLAVVSLFAAAVSIGLGGEAPKAPAPEPPKQPAPEPPKPAKLEPGTYARIQTDKGEIVIRLVPDLAKNTAANFVELAKGERPWKDAEGRWVARPFYNGLTFHRIEKDQLIQGGDPKGDGTGGPGYTFQDEISAKLSFDKPGMVAMANSGPDTNGSQFFITAAATPQYNERYSIFGEVVAGLDVVKAISGMPTKPVAPGRAAIHLASDPVAMKSVTIEEVKAQAEGEKAGKEEPKPAKPK